MKSVSATNPRYMELLSTLIFQDYNPKAGTSNASLQGILTTLQEIFEMSEERFGEFLQLADTHHVTVRALKVLQKAAIDRQKSRLQLWCEQALEIESSRITNAVEWLHAIVRALEDSGCY